MPVFDAAKKETRTEIGLWYRPGRGRDTVREEDETQAKNSGEIQNTRQNQFNSYS